MVDSRAFEALQCGLHIITTEKDGEAAGCVVNTVLQATVTPAQLIVIVNKENCTAQLMQQAGRFCAVALADDASMELIGAFGFHTSTEYDKFGQFPAERDALGNPYVERHAVARFSCEIVSVTDAGTHLIFLGKVLDAQRLSDKHAMTYAYYHLIKKGYTPPKASSYVPPAAKGYRCKVCGYVLESDSVPENFVCPVCKQGKDAMEPVG